MGKFDLDQYLKNRVKGHKGEVNTDEIWNDLNLEKDEKRRGFLFWFFLVIPILFLGISTWSILDLDKATSNPLIVNDEGNKSNTEKGIEKTIDQIKTNTSGNKLEKNINASTRANQTSNPSELINKKSDNAENLRNKKSINSSYELAQNKIYTADDKSNLYIKLSDNDKQVVELKLNEQDLPKSISCKNTKSLSIFNNLPIQDLQQLLISDRRKRSANELIILQDKKRILSKKISLGLYGGYSLISRDLVSLIDEQDDWVSLRNATESMLEITSMGLELSFDLNENYYIKSGLEFQSINERFNWFQTNNDTIPFGETILQQHLSIAGDTTNVTGPGLAIVDNQRTSKYYNSHQLYNLPISIGYKHQYNVWSLFMEGSFIMNFYNRFDGHQIDNALMEIEQPTYFTNQLILGAAGGLGLSYELNNRINIYAQARYQKMFNSFSNKQSGINQSYKSYGLRLGLNFRIK